MISLNAVEWGPIDADKKDPKFVEKWIEPDNIRSLLDDKVWLITGEKGSGKTAICRAIKEKHGERLFSISEVNFDKVGFNAIYMNLVEHNIDINWNSRRSREMFNEMFRGLKELSAGAGGKYKSSFLWTWPLRKLLTAHPLGGCTMSDDPDDGVVNEYGEVWNYPNLYVSDGSIIPTALSVNPSATISALSERVASRIVAG